MARVSRNLSMRNFFKNILFFLSGCAVILMNVYDRNTTVVGVILVAVLFLTACFFRNIHRFLTENVNMKIIALASFLAVLSAAVCYNSLLAFTSISGKFILLFYAAGCGIASDHFLCVILCMLKLSGKENKTLRNSDRQLTRMDTAALSGIIILVLGIGIWYLSQKCSYFPDEIYTFGLANSYYLPFLNNPLDGTGIVSTAERYREYLQVTSHPFSYGSVLYNQICDVHPPVYYLFIHTICSIAPQMSLMTAGYIVNAVFAALLIAAMFIWCFHRFGRVPAYGLILSYGLSTSFFSMLMLFRMYTALTCFAFMLIAVIYEIYTVGSEQSFRWLALILCLGALTQYYFLVYAFFACLLLTLFLILEKRWRDLGYALVSAIGAGIIYYCIWGGVIVSHVLGSSGTNVASNLIDSENFVRFKEYVHLFLEQISADTTVAYFIFTVLLLTVVLETLICLIRRDWTWLKGYLLLFLPGACCFAIIAMGSPVTVNRYIFYLVPTVWIALYVGLSHIIRAGKCLVPVSVAVTAISAYISLRCSVPSYLYLEYQDMAHYFEELSEDTICINIKVAPWYTEAICVNFFRDAKITYVIDETTVDWLKEQEIEGGERVVVLAENASLLEEVMDITGYKDAQMLWNYLPDESTGFNVIVYELTK